MHNESSTVTRILLVGEHRVVREALRLMLETQPDFNVIGTTDDWVGAIKLAGDRKAEIILLDLSDGRLPDRSGLDGAPAGASPRVMVLARELEQSDIVDAVRLGVRGVVLKDVTPELFFKSIRAVAAGQYWIGRETVADVVRGLGSRAAVTHEPQKSFGLTARELEIVSALTTGEANKDIAKQFAISERTVKHHLTNIFDKLGLSSRLEVALFALRHELILRPRQPRRARRFGSSHSRS